MKHLLTLFIITLFSFGYAQNDKESFTNEVKDQMKLVEQVNTAEEFIVYYGKKLMSLTEITVENAVDIISEEVPAVVKQYLIFESIRYGLAVVLGLILLYYAVKKVKQWYTIPHIKAIEYNENIDSSDEKEYKKPKKYMKIFNLYYKNIYMFISYIITFLIFLSSGIYLLISNLLIFIKVTFFPKLYLVELIINYIK